MKPQPSVIPEPQSRKIRIIAQDPSIRRGGRILTALVPVPVENLEPGPRGYRVHVIDYDSSTETLYKPYKLDPAEGDPFKKASNAELLANPGFHAQNVYAIVMRTLGAFEFALGRRVSWAFDSHQLQVAPHAFAVANAFYSRRDQALLFGYVGGAKDRAFTCLSHDVVAHETTHALLDGLRERYMAPSSKDQFAFHEGFADVVALLSVFALEAVVDALLDNAPADEKKDGTIAVEKTTAKALEESDLFGLGEEFGQVTNSRGNALRRSVTIEPGEDILDREEYKEPHRRGEIFVAAMMRSFSHVWHERISQLGEVAPGKLNRRRVVEDGAKAARHLMTMAIRALDYCPPTALTFHQYLTALIAADEDLQPDDSTYGYREIVKAQFAAYGIKCNYDNSRWRVGAKEQQKLVYSRTHFESMQRDPDEVFRFAWENRGSLRLNSQAYTKVFSVRPCIRQSSDGFMLRETVAEYVQILNVTYGEVAKAIEREVDEKAEDETLRLFGGGTLIFDEYGRLKYHAQNPIPDLKRDQERLAELWDWGLFEKAGVSALSQLHLTRATALPSVASKEETEW